MVESGDWVEGESSFTESLCLWRGDGVELCRKPGDKVLLIVQ